MQLMRIRRTDGSIAYGQLSGDAVKVFHPTLGQPTTLGLLLASEHVFTTAQMMASESPETLPLSGVKILAPIDQQEVWAAGVTYQRSKIAREEESVGAAQFYDKVYSADRPELFMKATPRRVAHPGDPLRIRADGKWNVPEPEWALVLSPQGKIVGYTIGNDMSSRDIEGENPLYLPQAKIYEGSCSLGPVITLHEEFPARETVQIHLTIERHGRSVFDATTGLAKLNRTAESLADWLFRENTFPDGAFLLTGTGIVPPDSFSLDHGDVVRIRIDGIGELTNPIA